MTEQTFAPRAAIHRLPPLRPANQLGARRACKICGSGCFHFDNVDFNKYCSIENYYEFGISGVAVDYWRCPRCNYIFTPFFDDWYPGDFTSYVYNDDYIMVDREYVRIRPEHIARDFARRLHGCEQARILDYGSGAGVFVTKMREHGFADVEGYDPFSSPERPVGRFDIVTCFEVIEHSPNPVATIADMLTMLKPDGCILFSQTLQPDNILSVRGSWWYLAPRHGHVSTYSEHTLVELGRRHGLKLHRGDTVYGFGTATASDYARIGLDSIGPSFATVRLLAPSQLGDRRIAFPGPEDVWWYPSETDGIWQYRWTGGPKVSWRVEWDPVAVLQVRVPILHEAAPGLADGCRFQINELTQPARRSAGDLVAEFAVAGHVSGTIDLTTPPAVMQTPDSGHAEPRGVALAIPVRAEPDWPG